MKARYLGKTSSLELTHDKIYTVLSVEKGWYRIVEDSNEDYLYPPDEFEMLKEASNNDNAEK